MSESDPTETSSLINVRSRLGAISHSRPLRKVLGFRHRTRRVVGGTHATARVHHAFWWRGSDVAVGRACAATGRTGLQYRIPVARFSRTDAPFPKSVRRRPAEPRLPR